jgi:serine/threonine-protein kinase RsbW
LTTASRQGKLQNPEELLPQASATPGVGDTSLFMTAQSKVSYRMESTLESVNKAEEMADQIAAQSGFDEDIRGGISMAVREAMINAVLHGNAYDPAKRVNLTFEQNNRELIITIGDEGRGLEPDEIPDPLAPENLMKQSGRGIFLIRAFMDEVRFRKLEPGTEITLIKRIPGSELDRQEAST